MPRIISIFQQENFDCQPCERVNLDIQRFTEYKDSDEHPADVAFENPALAANAHAVDRLSPDVPSILRYFLDGSRRTYKVADVVLAGKYLPIIAGQVGVAVIHRTDSGLRLEPLRQFCRIEKVIAVPDRIGATDVDRLQKVVKAKTGLDVGILRYEVKPDRDPVDLGVAQIMKHMQDLEVETVAAMSRSNLLRNEALLVVDGPLRFKEMRGRAFDIVQFRNVLGLSKSFRPSFSVGKGRGQKTVGAITAGLEFGMRTSAYKTIEDGKTVGMWYLRLRRRDMMTDPLQGIVKIECYAVDPDEKELGLDADRVNTVSAHILRERNVTPYGTDRRWACHIYPIHTAEAYLKASFMSDLSFQALF